MTTESTQVYIFGQWIRPLLLVSLRLQCTPPNIHDEALVSRNVYTRMLSRYGHEVRTTTLRTRLKLELQTEIGKQQVLQLQGSAHFNDRVLLACEQRLARIMDARLANHKN